MDLKHLREPPSAKFTPTGDPMIDHFDRRFHRTREKLIYMEETKIWQNMLISCEDKHGINGPYECRYYAQVIHERMRYYNSDFERATRPTLSPGLPVEYEKGEP